MFRAIFISPTDVRHTRQQVIIRRQEYRVQINNANYLNYSSMIFLLR